MPVSRTRIQQLLSEARRGSTTALGVLLETFRPYLLSLANDQLPLNLQSKGGGSDLVQETFLDAQRDFRCFQGATDAEFINWLRSVLFNNLANFRRHYFEVSKRDVTRELASGDLEEILCPNGTHPGIESPVQVAITREELLLLESALDQLPKPYREIVTWRSLNRISFRKIARALNTTETIAQSLWIRGIQLLRDGLRRRSSRSFPA